MQVINLEDARLYSTTKGVSSGVVSCRSRYFFLLAGFSNTSSRVDINHQDPRLSELYYDYDYGGYFTTAVVPVVGFDLSRKRCKA